MWSEALRRLADVQEGVCYGDEPAHLDEVEGALGAAGTFGVPFVRYGWRQGARRLNHRRRYLLA